MASETIWTEDRQLYALLILHMANHNREIGVEGYSLAAGDTPSHPPFMGVKPLVLNVNPVIM